MRYPRHVVIFYDRWWITSSKFQVYLLYFLLSSFLIGTYT